MESLYKCKIVEFGLQLILFYCIHTPHVVVCTCFMIKTFLACYINYTIILVVQTECIQYHAIKFITCKLQTL